MPFGSARWPARTVWRTCLAWQDDRGSSSVASIQRAVAKTHSMRAFGRYGIFAGRRQSLVADTNRCSDEEERCEGRVGIGTCLPKSKAALLHSPFRRMFESTLRFHCRLPLSDCRQLSCTDSGKSHGRQRGYRVKQQHQSGLRANLHRYAAKVSSTIPAATVSPSLRRRIRAISLFLENCSIGQPALWPALPPV